MLDDIHRAFSSPLLPCDERMLTLIAAEHARSVTARFLDDRRAEIGEALAGCLAALPDVDGPLSLYFDPVFGMLGHAIAGRREIAAPSYAAEACLALHAAGVEGEWDFRLEGPARLRFAGRFVLPRAEEGRIVARGGRVTVDLHGQAPVTFRRERNDWTLISGNGVGELPRVRKIVFLSEDALDGRDYGVIPAPVALPDEPLLAAWRGALTLIRSASPRYAAWTERVIRYVIPLVAPEGAMLNGSQGHRPAEVHMSTPSDPLRLAEMLIHEASHQHFFLATRLGAVDDGSDKALHYSPLVREGRPIERILLAYHAVANILLFYRAYEAAGLPRSDFFHRNREQLLGELAQLDEPLQRTGSLTAVGLGMYAPLAEAMAAREQLR
jgi:HEXXH motif-containing protein